MPRNCWTIHALSHCPLHLFSTIQLRSKALEQLPLAYKGSKSVFRSSLLSIGLEIPSCLLVFSGLVLSVSLPTTAAAIEAAASDWESGYDHYQQSKSHTGKIFNLDIINVPSTRVGDPLNFEYKPAGDDSAFRCIPSRRHESLFAPCSSNILRLEPLWPETRKLLVDKSGDHVVEDHAVAGLSLRKCEVYRGARRA
jgi:hypothetical protein